MLMNDQQRELRDNMEIIKAELETLRKENASLKVSASKGVELQSAMQSNNAAI